MIDEEKYLIVDSKNEDITKYIISYVDNVFYADFGKGKVYPYNGYKLKIYSNPILVSDVVIKTNFGILNNIKQILKFDEYYKIFFYNGTNKLYLERELLIENNLLKNSKVMELFNYFNEMASNLTMDDLRNTIEEFGDSINLNENFLESIYSKIKFINESSVVSSYCFGKINEIVDFPDVFVYPFSFNLSQKEALKKAFSNNLTVIEGPPGTGKTQTILNIIANLIVNNKTVAVVSNNNTATKNVYDKLEKQGLSFLCASLGKNDNIKSFIDNQCNFKEYPSYWKLDDNQVNEIYSQLKSMDSNINKYLTQKNNLARINQELDELKLEKKYFLNSKKNQNCGIKQISFPEMDADKLHSFFLYLNKQNNKNEFFNLKVQLFSLLKFKFIDINLYKNTIKDILENLEDLVYTKLIEKLEYDKKSIEEEIINLNFDKEFEEYTRLSMMLFKNVVFRNYNIKDTYNKNTVKNTLKLVKDYPIIMSTTYSLSKCVMSGFLFDYVIVDESSQVDIVSAFPSLCLAKNLIIVGDSKQLPNIVKSEKISLFNSIFAKYDLDDKYNYTINSLLDLTKNISPYIPVTMLKEHYRCHPKIIDFCNKKFYNDELIILSKSNNDDPIKQYKCVKGNFQMVKDNSLYNMRQAEIIFDEVIPQENIDVSKDSVGIITPYKAQKKYLLNNFDCKSLEVDTVHGFQGREKDVIIFSTVADRLNEFLDNPNIINVAVSRAVNKFVFVTPYEYSGGMNSSILSLISYINYNNLTVVQSEINSVFDLLYKVNEDERKNYLFGRLIYSKFDSENIMFNVICEILSMEKYSDYDVKRKVYPIKKLINNFDVLTFEEKSYVYNNAHVDFLIFNKFDKMPLLAIEVDGYTFHQSKRQQIRDEMKNEIFRKINIPLIRFSTKDSNIEDKLKNKLNEIIEK